MARSLTALAFAAVLAGTMGVAQAAPVLDQSYLGTIQASGGIGLGVSSNPIVAQTFTVGLAGELSRVSFAVADVGDVGGTLIAQIRSTASGVPTGTVLASVALTPLQVPDTLPGTIGAGDLTTIDLSAFDIQVNVGDVLAITLSEPNLGAYSPGWLGTPDAHAGGRVYLDVGSGFVTLDMNLDMFFQTFVDPDPQGPQAVPEPATLGMVGIGILALGALRLRRL